MEKFIKDFWILSESGIVLYKYNIHEIVDSNLFGSMVSALSLYAENLKEGGLCSFELGQNYITLIKDQTFLFIANCSKKIEEIQVKETIKCIAEKFFDIYPKETIKDWIFELTTDFSEFNNQIAEYLK